MKNFCIFIGMITLVVGLWLYSLVWIEDHIKDATKAGVFGDQFGAINALFSGLAFAGLIYTILLQKDELRATQEEIRNQTKELEEQNKTLSLQRFENTFFQLLGSYSHSKEKSFYSEVYIEFKKRCIDRIGTGNTTTIKQVQKQSFEKSNSQHDSFSSYFSVIGELVAYVDSSKILEDDQKRFYIKVLCSNLSDSEIWLLFYAVLFDARLADIKFYIEKYAMFKNLKKDGLIWKNDDIGEFSVSAYAD